MRALVVTRGLAAWRAIAFILLMAVAGGSAAAEPSTHDEILARIHALDLRLQQRIELARLNFERGTLDRSAVATDARRFGANVEALEAAVRRLAPADRVLPGKYKHS